MGSIAAKAGEIRQSVERDIHPEGARDAAISLDPPEEVAIERVRIDELQIQ